MTMPRQFLNQLLTDMQPGDEGRIPTWGVKIDGGGRAWLLRDQTCYRGQIGGETVRIRRDDDGYRIWTRDGHAWFRNKNLDTRDLIPVTEVLTTHPPSSVRC